MSSATEPDYETISAQRHGRVVRLSLSRPDRLNALDPTMLEEILDALRRLDDEGPANALVITGTGRLFSAGVDLTSPFFMENVDDTSVYSGKRLLDWQHQMIEVIYELPCITVAAVNGDAIGGGGLGMAMACDLRVAVRSARFWMVPSALAVVQDFGLSWLVQRLIGPSRTLQMAVLGQPVPAEQAVQWGLVNELVDDQDALALRMDELVKHLDGLGTDALRMLKVVVRGGATSPLREQLRIEAIANGLAFQSQEFAQRKADYLESLRKGRTS